MSMAGAKTSWRGRLLVGLVLSAVLAVVWWFLREDDSLKVPLGVEQAAIITYGGPGLVVKPFRYGVAVNVRIAQVTELAGMKVYDVRYLVNREGEHDLTQYLMSDDGTVLSGLPSFKVQGDPKLSKELEARVKETEAIGIQVWGHYRATLWALSVFWIGWLFLLIFWKRPRQPVVVAPKAPLTVAEQLQALLGELEQGGLTAEQKARLEMLLLRLWREGLVPSDAPMAEVLSAVARAETTGEALVRLQRWLHRPGSGVVDAEIADIIRRHLLARGIARP
ncbi:MAG: hypothetical protein EBR95_08220 [Verrucomicrobia bacterium]|nr:hypothetical protein [Verrucomicrobiota bacterium]